MRKVIGCAAAALLVGATTVQAGGIDRSGQSIGPLFEQGRYLELSLGRVSPSISGKDVAVPFGGTATGDVARDFTQLSFGYKADLSDKLSYAIIVDQPFGADVAYGGGVALNGTTVSASSVAATVLLRYRLNGRFSVHGGLRADKASAGIDLRGAAYGALNGYSVALSDDIGLGYVLGAAYEIPDIALRVAVTYHSAITHDFPTIETGLPGGLGVFNNVPSVTRVETPQSVNLDAQSGIAKDTLLFGQIRWVDWSAFKLQPRGFVQAPGQSAGLIGLEDTFTYTLGVGRRLNDTWSGAFSVTYEAGTDPLVSPLAPADGRLGATLAAVYTRDSMKITTGINYTRLGDASPQTAQTARANMTGSSALGIGVKIGFTF